MGVWIETPGAQDLGEIQIVFDGQQAKETSVQVNLVTAAIGAEQLEISGNKKIFIKQVRIEYIFPVGEFVVNEK